MNTHKLLKFCNRFNETEIYYSYSHWPGKEIDGVEFLAVVTSTPSHHHTQTLKYMRKDSLKPLKALQ